jgi:hypothetical protein
MLVLQDYLMYNNVLVSGIGSAKIYLGRRKPTTRAVAPNPIATGALIGFEGSYHMGYATK